MQAQASKDGWRKWVRMIWGPTQRRQYIVHESRLSSWAVVSLADIGAGRGDISEEKKSWKKWVGMWRRFGLRGPRGMEGSSTAPLNIIDRPVSPSPSPSPVAKYR